MNTYSQPFSDDEIMMFADGQADADLAQEITFAMQSDPDLENRIKILQAQAFDIKDAFDLGRLAAPKVPEHLLAKKAQSGRIAPQLIRTTALAASFVFGLIAMHLLEPAPTWVERVASYQALYVTDTLAGGAQAPGKTEAVLSQMKRETGVTLQAIPDVPGMVFKRAQLLAIDDAPLLQIAYLSEDGTPFALCIVAASNSGRAVETTRSHNLATATWTKNGVGYVFIGGTDAARVSNVAEGLSSEI
ncbi:hypothetical protein [Sulfitobacter donghicola]|uniref:Anti-sigma factor n=1 Tax=Sulfitobacter donghicola DSW-25 = KCTC 12864 = JCM 14565 TaxID=1300350 RepID=A0A073IS11_9RHOB|nr:hypothetical protein [Sulfitobacter donghicola]KEJ88192.1 hypothetical protein DSW25_16080 [Sulfitobacter donghicola DSW-25 = KCTC 12864 = JCM 14565]KIN68783.1 Transmembrane anti-sigma factor [Sulfitobacter donghicola DSW-25 = KCTC 12864 = JCM 14565]